LHPGEYRDVKPKPKDEKEEQWLNDGRQNPAFRSEKPFHLSKPQHIDGLGIFLIHFFCHLRRNRAGFFVPLCGAS